MAYPLRPPTSIIFISFALSHSFVAQISGLPLDQLFTRLVSIPGCTQITLNEIPGGAAAYSDTAAAIC